MTPNFLCVDNRPASRNRLRNNFCEKLFLQQLQNRCNKLSCVLHFMTDEITKPSLSYFVISSENIMLKILGGRSRLCEIKTVNRIQANTKATSEHPANPGEQPSHGTHQRFTQLYSLHLQGLQFLI